ncbi:MAG TPA: DUF481 domain-containing protein, partial [Sediminibacterium sp.]|nr:DUF481 domain-containing protein [Sediminibacterium sp.]
VISSGLEVDKQQHTLWDATNTAEASYQRNKDLLLAAASYRFTYNGPDDILNAGYFHLRFRHQYKNKYQPEFFMQYQWDNKRGMDYRYIAGANMRYNFWKGDQVDLNAGVGCMYETEKWNYAAVDSVKIPSNPVPVTIENIKLNSYLRLNWKASANSDVVASIFLQTRFSGFQPRIAPSFQWNVHAGKHLGMSFSFAGLYDSAPVVPISHFYFSFSNSLQWQL